MSFLREMGITAALLAATGGAAIATWNYFSAKRRKDTRQECTPEEKGAAELEQEKTHAPSIVPHSSQGGHRDISEEEEHATGPGTLSAPVYTVQEENTTLTQTPTVQVEAERAHIACTVQRDRSQPQRSMQEDDSPESAYTVQGDGSQPERSMQEDDRRSQPERSAVQETADTLYTVQDDKSAQTSTVQVEAERAHIACTVQRDRSQPQRSMQEDDRRSQPERSAVQETADTLYTVQDDKSAQTSTVQVEAERAHIACTVQGDRSQPERSMQEDVRRSAVQVEAETADTLYTVQDNKSAQTQSSTVQVASERSDSTYTVQEDRKSQPERSAVQVEAEKAHSNRSQMATAQVEGESANIAHTVLENRSAEQLTPPVEPTVMKELSDNNICTEIQPEVKASSGKQVVVLGLDGSGKTSVLNSLAANKGKIVTTPTEGVNAMCVNNGASKMEFLEIGGSEHLRPYWKMYLSRAFAVIYVVDSADHSRLPLAKRHLHQLIQQDAIIPLIVLANKQDLKNAYHITEIHEALGLADICENRKLFLIGTYAINGESEVSSGILDAKEFIAQLLSESSAKISELHLPKPS